MSVRKSRFHLYTPSPTTGKFQLYATSYLDWDFMNNAQSEDLDDIMDVKASNIERSILALIYVMKATKR